MSVIFRVPVPCGARIKKEVVSMRKWVRGMVSVLAVCGLFAALPGPACTTGLTIGDGVTVYVRDGASISLGCQSVVIEDRGRLYLDVPYTYPESGALYRCGKVQVDPGGYLWQGHGKIVHCTVDPQIMLLLLE